MHITHTENVRWSEFGWNIFTNNIKRPIVCMAAVWYIYLILLVLTYIQSAAVSCAAIKCIRKIGLKLRETEGDTNRGIHTWTGLVRYLCWHWFRIYALYGVGNVSLLRCLANSWKELRLFIRKIRTFHANRLEVKIRTARKWRYENHSCYFD